MATDQFKSAEVLVFKPESVKRTAINKCLRALGFRKINQASSFEELNQLLQTSSPDILLCASDYADEDLIKLVQSLREGLIAPNPFLVVLAMSWCSDDETVTAYRNAGVDGFLSFPLSPPKLGNFLQGQIEQRKKFVATADYVGPDRRRDPARSGTECFKVVNSFRLKGIGSPAGEIESQVTTALQKSIVRLGAARRRADVMQLCIQWRLLERSRSGSPDAKNFLRRLRAIAQDVESRAEQASENTTRHHCHTICDATTSMEAMTHGPADNETEKSIACTAHIERIGRAVFSLAELFAPESVMPMTSPELDELAAKIDVRRHRPKFSVQPLSLAG